MLSVEHLRMYRHLLREINRQFTRVNGNRAWASQLRLHWHCSSDTNDPQQQELTAAKNVLSYLANSRKYKELLAEFNPKMSEGDRIKKTANRVGLETPNTY
ncbi:hypothetical protein J3B02_000957 [Coemansia erecta]|uniref:Uncharacterized protein n=1 Tax=Coemansia asiatica TaxID=1052880 RepID=A0A9W7XMG5_9FUNG|nr:hypothetical protein LPJ64_000754 [Coemansia asiatica]KAJ2857490.1 hypothetical protein J3B02_000957 [Coemansia erecta]KAJ2887946.1 hypothetical protein FB639_000974 [Coemansia asiatica]